MNKTSELYLSVDVETTHEVPGLGSMLSLGVAPIVWHEGSWIGLQSFYKKLCIIPGTEYSSGVAKFWGKNPSAWSEARFNPIEPEIVMREFADWCRLLEHTWKRKLVTVCNPAGYDFSFLRYYMVRFTGSDKPLGYRCVDVRTYASAKLGLPYADSGKSAYLPQWTADKFEHTHRADDDAREQAWQWARMLDSQ